MKEQERGTEIADKQIQNLENATWLHSKGEAQAYEIEEAKKAIRRTMKRYRKALADAIRRPMGVIPDSARGLVDSNDLELAEQRRSYRLCGGTEKMTMKTPEDEAEVASHDLLANWLEVLVEYMDSDSRSWQIVEVGCNPKGERQESDCALFDHEYVEQSRAYGDTYHGYLYFPMGDQCGGYIKIYFCS